MWDVLSRVAKNGMGCFVPGCFVWLPCPNSVNPDQTAHIGAVCSGSTLFASLLNASEMLGNYLQQTTSADDILRCILFLAL